MKAGFLNSTTTTTNSSDLGPLQDERSRRTVKFLWSGGPDTISSKPVSWGWNTGGKAPGWIPPTTLVEAPSPGDAIMADTEESPLSKSKSESLTKKNPYQQVPILPYKTMGVPKNALSSWYGKRHKNLTIQNKYFTTWNDGGIPHLLKWTCLFTCPVTGEKFPSGQFGDKSLYQVGLEQDGPEEKDASMMEDTTSEQHSIEEKETMTNTRSSKDTTVPSKVVWYNKKIAAEHAAAARAMDCLHLREECVLQTGVTPLRLCIEEPYIATEEIHIQQIGTLRTTESKSPSHGDPKKRRPFSQCDASDNYRNQYRQQRRPYHHSRPPPPRQHQHPAYPPSNSYPNAPPARPPPPPPPKPYEYSQGTTTSYSSSQQPPPPPPQVPSYSYHPAPAPPPPPPPRRTIPPPPPRTSPSTWMPPHDYDRSYQPTRTGY